MAAERALQLWAWGGSDPGRKRERNEDSYLIAPELGVVAVADGMGGHQGGSTASRMAVELLVDEVRIARDDFDAAVSRHRDLAERVTDQMAALADTDPEIQRGLPKTEEIIVVTTPALELLRGIIRRASSTIFDAARQEPALRGMGTTFTAALLHDGKLHTAHAGDSRCYLIRNGTIRQLTTDHSWIEEQVRGGFLTEREAKASKFRHVITKSIGFERDTDADLKSHPIEAGDLLVLCSDGMSNYIEPAELARVTIETPPAKLPERLVGLANERGGDDNITVVVGLLAAEPPAP